MPAASAISRVRVPLNPFRENSSTAASTICCRRSSALRRAFILAPLNPPSPLLQKGGWGDFGRSVSDLHHDSSKHLHTYAIQIKCQLVSSSEHRVWLRTAGALGRNNSDAYYQ